MTSDVVAQIARTVLYEGHLLYPYRRSALKNRQPWSFGTLAPQAWSEIWGDTYQFKAQCIAVAQPGATLDVSMRFLHLTQLVSKHAAGTQCGEAIERTVAANGLSISELSTSSLSVPFSFAKARHEASSPYECRSVNGILEISAEQCGNSVVRLTVICRNSTAISRDATRDEALLSSLVATHAALTLEKGEFISLLDPPRQFVAEITSCDNQGVFPVLVGEAGQRHQMLASPIILYDYPEVAPESPTDFFDATEMDEMLALRVLTLTDAEKQEIRASSPQGRAILERTESLPPEQLSKLHGAIRGLRKIEEQP